MRYSYLRRRGIRCWAWHMQRIIRDLRGKVFWPWMSKQVHHMVSRCEPCQRLAKSNTQEDVEVKHTTLFNTYPGHTLHADYFELNNKDYLIMVDRLTGFSKCEMTPHNGTDAAIKAIKNWGVQYGTLTRSYQMGGQLLGKTSKNSFLPTTSNTSRAVHTIHRATALLREGCNR